MAEYIEREATVELLRSLGNRDYRREKGTIQDAIKMVSYPEYTPTADVVPVVRCRDCIRRYDTDECPMCFLIEGKYYEYTNENGFCDRGERKEGAD